MNISLSHSRSLKLVPFESLVWNPHILGLIKDLEKVQMRAIKLVISIKNLTYNRLKRLKLPTLNIDVLEVI